LSTVWYRAIIFAQEQGLKDIFQICLLISLTLDLSKILNGLWSKQLVTRA